ncbi:MAG: zinc-ribbon domain-containing protein [Promethearchaeota archaeon]
MTNYCPYCGNTVKDRDRYCIACGKPLVTNISKSNDISKKSKNTEKTKNIQDEEINKKGKEKKKKEKLEKSEEKEIKQQEKIVKELPPEVKEQMDLHIDLIIINSKKKRLAEKLDNLLKEMKDSRYETDFEFAEQINLKLEAVKTLIKDVKQEEIEIKKKVKNQFIIDKLNNDIKNKREQLKNLTREYKLRKMDKEVFQNLREKYKQELIDIETEKADILLGIKSWVTELIMKKDNLISEQKILKGRYSAKEITENEFNKEYNMYNRNIKKFENKIAKLKELAKIK